MMSIRALKTLDGWDWSRLEQLFQCPVCYDMPFGPVYQCEQGHHVCSICKTKLTRCPLCTSAYSGTRNFICEELLTNIESLKKIVTIGQETLKSNSNSSSTVSDSSSSIEKADKLDKIVNANETSKLQSKGLYPCLINKCKKRLPLALIYNHLRNSHASNFTEGDSNGETFTQQWELTYKKNWRHCEAIKVYRMNLFFFTIMIDAKGDVNAFVQMVGKAKIAQTYMASIRVSWSSSPKDVASISVPITSSRVSPAEVMGTKKALNIPASNFKGHNNKNFTCTLALKYVGKPALQSRDDDEDETPGFITLELLQDDLNHDFHGFDDIDVNFTTESDSIGSGDSNIIW